MSFEGSMVPLNLQNIGEDHDLNNVETMTMAQLSAIKSDIEAKLSDLFDLLKTQNATMETNLVTLDGFPRADMDVVQVRLARTRIIRLRNDLNRVLAALEDKLQDHFKQQTTQKDTANNQENSIIAPDIPFAQVTELVEGSPAQTSGLLLNDKIVLFGHLHAGNHNKLKRVAEVAVNHENVSNVFFSIVQGLYDRILTQQKALDLVVARDGEQLSIQLVPHRNWNGKGLLGCRLVPL